MIMLTLAVSIGHIGEVPDITKVISFLVSSESGWITWGNIGVNGGTASPFTAASVLNRPPLGSNVQP